MSTSEASARTTRQRDAGCHVIAVVNQKGGVGKTTTAVNLAASVAAAERRTLLVDLDPQGNASSGVGVSPRTVERSVYDALIGRASMRDVMQSRRSSPSLMLVPSKQDLVAVEIELVDDPDRPYKLRDALGRAARRRSRSSTSSSTARRRSASSRSTRSPRPTGCSCRCSASTTRSRG